MEAAADGEGEGSSSFRCADAARYAAYAVASVVTILVVVVVVKAVMVLRPIPLYLSVRGGSVLIKGFGIGRNELDFTFSLLAENPSNRVQMYYTGVEGRIYGKNISASSNSDYIIVARFLFPYDFDLSLSQRSELTRDVSVVVQRFPKISHIFDMLYEAISSGAGIVTDLTLRLDGTLITRTIPGGSNTTGRQVSFYCRPLLVLASGNLPRYSLLNKQDAFCVSGGTPWLRRAKA